MRQFLFLLLVSSFLVFTGCGRQQKNKKQDHSVVIALTKANYDKNGISHYGRWLTANDSTIRWVNLYPLGLDSAMRVLSQCDGLVATGGEDVNPALHGKGNETAKCGTIDHYRDSLEQMAIRLAIKKQMPLTGICRGHQILNVTLGGSLFTDIPTDHPSGIHHRCAKADTCLHWIYIEHRSLLYEISGMDSALVNSAHHQAIDRLAGTLMIGAIAKDSIIESVNPENFHDKSFVLGVQFHPERLDIRHGISHRIAKRFLEEVHLYNQKKL